MSRTDAFLAIDQGASVLVGSRVSAARCRLGSLADVTALAWLADSDNGGGHP
jgi:hypothetical protein